MNVFHAHARHWGYGEKQQQRQIVRIRHAFIGREAGSPLPSSHAVFRRSMILSPISLFLTAIARIRIIPVPIPEHHKCVNRDGYLIVYDQGIDVDLGNLRYVQPDPAQAPEDICE